MKTHLAYMMVKQALRPETLPALQLATMAGAGAAVPGAILGGVAGVLEGSLCKPCAV